MQPKLLALKGDFYARIAGTSGPYLPLLNATAGQITMSVTTVKQKSNGNVPGTLAEVETDREAKIDITLQSRHKENLEKFLYANSVVRPAATSIAATLPAGPEGAAVNLGASDITTATFGTKVADVDYKLWPKSGIVQYLTAFTTSVSGTFSHGEYVEYGIFSADGPELEILFASENSNQLYDLYRARLSPAQAYALVEDTGAFGSAQISGTLLIDSTKPVDVNLGQYGRLRSVE